MLFHVPKSNVNAYTILLLLAEKSRTFVIPYPTISISLRGNVRQSVIPAIRRLSLATIGLAKFSSDSVSHTDRVDIIARLAMEPDQGAIGKMFLFAATASRNPRDAPFRLELELVNACPRPYVPACGTVPWKVECLIHVVVFNPVVELLVLSISPCESNALENPLVLAIFGAPATPDLEELHICVGILWVEFIGMAAIPTKDASIFNRHGWKFVSVISEVGRNSKSKRAGLKVNRGTKQVGCPAYMGCMYKAGLPFVTIHGLYPPGWVTRHQTQLYGLVDPVDKIFLDAPSRGLVDE